MLFSNFHNYFSKPFLILFLAISFLTAKAQQASNPYIPAELPDRIILNTTQDPSTSMAVNWRTQESVTESFAEIAVASADPRFVDKVKRIKAKSEKVVFNETPTAMYHSVVFDNLKPNTKYAYRVGQGENWSEWIHFNTAGKVGEKFSFLYYGDVQVNIRSMWSRVAREAFGKAPDAKLAIYAGDLINKANRDVEWGDWFQAGGFIHSMIPGFPTPGNHDHYEGPNGKPLTSVFWRPQFTLPENGPVDLEETCYYADIQGTRFISLNSDRAEESDEYLEKQRVWIEKVLSNNPNKWTVVTFHHPIFSPKSTRDNKRMRETFKPIFDKYKVDLVLQGHDHTYARGMAKIPMAQKGATSGTMYVVSVSGPKMTDSNVEKRDWMDRSALYTQFYHVVTVDHDKLSFETLTATGELYDAFDLIKQKGKINKLIDGIPQNVQERR
ncbi:fibronectin type III domain-containing protein [Dyadobacter subterraneus]|uniref:Metallophosphoesterase family protein n=1 Tax=Dyadobacter subterraneus TaxID=2773304 RepID=A0ABR9W4L1_9BACT|nr:metallophosphoesterase family protein [Dyadobacter subterraneus]MBE9460388.1 metallophosphoesterase family protein [Dyadobacter subterraneus]